MRPTCDARDNPRSVPKTKPAPVLPERACLNQLGVSPGPEAARLRATFGTRRDGNAVYAFARTGGNLFDLQVGPDGALYAMARVGATNLVHRYQFP